MTTAAMTAAERRYLDLLELEPAQGHVRRRLGLAESDPAALRRVAELYEAPAWSKGCVSRFDAMFLYDMVRGVRPRRVVEVGVASGGSTATILAALADAGVPLVDERGEAAVQGFDVLAHCYFDPSRPVGSAVREMAPGLEHGVRVHTGRTAVDAGRMLAGQGVGLAFIDADHRHPCASADLLALVPALAPGAWVVLHDIMLDEATRRWAKKSGKMAADGGQHGAQWLFEGWPFEKIRGGGDAERVGAGNIGAVRLPEDRAVTAADLRHVIDRAWETQPEKRAAGLLAV